MKNAYNKQNHIDSKELIAQDEFTKLASILDIKKYEFTTIKEPYDVKMRFEKQLYISETKVRADRDTCFFYEYGPYLELKKIEGMYAKQQELLKQGIIVSMWYINITQDSYMIYELAEPWKYTFEWKKLPKDNYNNELVWKMVSSLTKPIKVIKK